MPYETNIGLLPLPVPAGAEADALPDPAALALLDYFGFWLRTMLDSKLLSMGGDVPERSDPSLPNRESHESAAPPANLFPYNPEPGQIWRRNPKPALYVWWSGRSRTEQKTILIRNRLRELSYLWVWCETQAPQNDEIRYGTLAAVDGIIRLAIEEGYHPAYGYNGAALGTPIWKSAGFVELTANESAPGVLAPVPETGSRMNESPGQILNYYPAVKGTLTIAERIGRIPSAEAPQVNEGVETTVTTNESAEAQGGVELVELIVPGPPPYPPIQ
jgi:hypothetical protein